MHMSWFQFYYPVERPYPFGWLRWLVLFGGIVVCVPLSFLSVATQGYETIAIYTPDPNATETNQTPFEGFPLRANTDFVRSPTLTPVNTHFLTNNTALTYTLRSVTHSSDPNRHPALAASVPYKNNPLKDCRIEAIEIELESVQRNALQIARQEWGSAAKAYITCTTETDTGSAGLNLMTSYEHTSVDRSSSFASPDNTTKASLSLGEALCLGIRSPCPSR
ncbi:hypothetical protein B0T14DRAFT_555674 [Immersiella caudata]|uniref:Uncharacterized protein n=1 Tax=Immersiella caudata TaxID=314043 RepID=A0AA40C0W2_9PEZI|nr:hypothetical protein B0T14DRAFT_555674 [Immersiella caudata]